MKVDDDDPGARSARPTSSSFRPFDAETWATHSYSGEVARAAVSIFLRFEGGSGEMFLESFCDADDGISGEREVDAEFDVATKECLGDDSVLVASFTVGYEDRVG